MQQNQTHGAYRTSAKNPPEDTVAIVIAEVVLVIAVASYGAALDLVGFFRSRHGRMATLVVVLTTVMAAYQLWDLGYENRQLQAQVTELRALNNALVAVNEADVRFSSARRGALESLQRQLVQEQFRADSLEADYEYEHLSRQFSDQQQGLVPVGSDPYVMDDFGEICHDSELLGPEGTCPL